MKYLSIYGHQGPLNHPPKILHPPTQKEIESYDFYYQQCVADILPYEPSPFIRESLGLPLLPLQIESVEVLRPPSRFFGHHNQVLNPRTSTPNNPSNRKGAAHSSPPRADATATKPTDRTPADPLPAMGHSLTRCPLFSGMGKQTT